MGRSWRTALHAVLFQIHKEDVFDEWCSIFKVLLAAVSHTASAACPGLSPFTMQSLGNLIFGHLLQNIFLSAFCINCCCYSCALFQTKNKAAEILYDFIIAVQFYRHFCISDFHVFKNVLLVLIALTIGNISFFIASIVSSNVIESIAFFS